MPDQPELLAQRLSQHPDYRVLRRLTLTNPLGEDTGRPLARGVVIDTETTGLNPSQDRIIEIGLLAFDYDPLTGQPIRLLDSFAALEDPGCPITPEITQLTGISNEMVAGQTIDEIKIEQMLAGTSLVVAHHAAFDRPFLEQRIPLFSRLPWGCSLQDIPWEQEGLGSKKLDYLAFQLGFFFDAHRTMGDCQALLRILSLPLPRSGRPGLWPIVQRLTEKTYTIYALSSPFSSKDRLKERHYRWNPERKLWYRELTQLSALEEEKTWLKQGVYAGKSVNVEVVERDASTRYSTGHGNLQIVAL